MALKHVVVDGSNIATEGRSMPSLQQLDEAVQAFLADQPVKKLTVVVDATFGHRIPAKERAEYEEAIVNGEIVCPPAGAIGRGDAFVLQIADKAGATVLSNDSFQEFHAEYPWLFDEGRLIGGKPVPEVGWVFVARAPVRGPVSRQATKNARGPRRPRRSSTKAALEADTPKNPPVPTGQAPKVGDVGVPATVADEAVESNGTKAPSGKRRPSKKTAPSRTEPATDGIDTDSQRSIGRRGRGRRGSPKLEPTNELLPFLDFIGSHPVGSEVEAEVERFSSHGAYLRVGDVLGYAPLRLMGDPPPRSPRDFFDMGGTYTVTVVALDAPRRGVDLTLPQFASDAISAAAESSADGPDDLSGPVVGDGPAATAASPDDTPAASDKAEETPTMATPRKTAAKKSTTRKKSPAKKTTAARKSTAKKSTAKKAPARKTSAKKSTAKKSPARKSTAAKKSTAKRNTAKKSTAKKSTARKSPARKSSR